MILLMWLYYSIFYKTDITESLRYILIGSSTTTTQTTQSTTSPESKTNNSVETNNTTSPTTKTPPANNNEIVELLPRSPQELYELVCLICELLPALPSTGIFTIDTQLKKGTTHHNTQLGMWQWKDEKSIWHSYTWVDNRIIEAAYQGGEEEISLSTLGRNYIIDFSNMQQVCTFLEFFSTCFYPILDFIINKVTK